MPTWVSVLYYNGISKITFHLCPKLWLCFKQSISIVKIQREEQNECPNQLSELLKASYLLSASRLKMHTDVLNVFVFFGSVVPKIMQHLLGDKDSFSGTEQGEYPLYFSCAKHSSNCSIVTQPPCRQEKWSDKDCLEQLFGNFIITQRQLDDKKLSGNCRCTKLFMHLGKKKQKPWKSNKRVRSVSNSDHLIKTSQAAAD